MLIEWKNPHDILETKRSHVWASISVSKTPHVIKFYFFCRVKPDRYPMGIWQVSQEFFKIFIEKSIIIF
jgi:hypothetical protein